jgi:hypothetical protein
MVKSKKNQEGAKGDPLLSTCFMVRSIHPFSERVSDKGSLKVNKVVFHAINTHNTHKRDTNTHSRFGILPVR